MPVNVATAYRPLRAALTAGVAGKAAELLTLAALALVVPPVLGPAAYGHFALALTLVTVGTLALTLGGPTTLARFVGAAPAAERPGLARGLTARLARPRLLAVAGLALSVAALEVVAPGALDGVQAAWIVLALAAGVGATLLLQAGLGLGRTTEWSARYAVQNALTLAAALVLADRFGETGAVAGIAVATLATLLWAAWRFAPVLLAAEPAPVGADALRFGAWQAAAAALVQVAHRGGVVVVAIAASAHETGYAALAIGVALAATYVVAQAFTVALPGLTARAGSDAAHAQAALRRLAWQAVAVCAAASVAGAALASEFVPAVFGDAYAPASTALAYALAMVPPSAVCAFGVQAAALELRERAAFAPATVGVAVFLAIAVATVPSGGAEAAAAATAAGSVAAALAWGATLEGTWRMTAVATIAAALTAAIGALA